jgi:restriction system-associated AAA family ATPase
MKLLSLQVNEAASCGGLLDGLVAKFSPVSAEYSDGHSGQLLAPHCLIGPNGSGKSQFLQLLAEIFQSAWHVHSPEQEREPSDRSSLFSLEYLIESTKGIDERIRLRRERKGARVQPIDMHVLTDGNWELVDPGDEVFGARLPSLIVGYTSGDNETLSLPFFVSRRGYSTDVREAALHEGTSRVADNRLLLIDYSTHLEVLVANLLLGEPDVQLAILEHANLSRLASFRCIVQLNHLQRVKSAGRGASKRKGVQLTEELEGYISALRSSATCWSYDDKLEIYTFDVLVTEATISVFKQRFKSSILLYRAFHKLGLLNDLAIPRDARNRLKKEIDSRRFASRLPEPQDEEKIFRFEQVRFFRGAERDINKSLDYVSLSDGEHQQAQVLGVFAMIVDANALFILDEPESHFNPRWRVEFVKRLLEIPVVGRGSQEVLLTSHAPFVPSDLRRSQVHVFSKRESGSIEVNNPAIETYGMAFDRILDHCFGVSPPISQLARDEIGELLKNGSIEQLSAALTTIGTAFERAAISDRLRTLEKAREAK